jgi:hypothetical protein
VILNLINFSINQIQDLEKEEKTHQSKKIEFTEMSSEHEFFDKLEPLASLVKEKPSPVIQKELIVSP